jgi:hypothetical protein
MYCVVVSSANLPANPSPTPGATSGSSFPSSEVPALGGIGSATRLLTGPPRHMRTSSLGSIGSLDSALSPEIGHRWNDMPQPSVSPAPPLPGSLGGPSSSSLTGAHGSPTSSYLPRSFGSDGLAVSSMPPSAVNPASGTSMGLSAGSSSALWSADKSRPGFASSALVSRLTARNPGLSPLSVVAPLPGSSNWPAAQGSPTPSGLGVSGMGHGHGLSGAAGYNTYAMSPVGGVGGLGSTPNLFGSSPGGFFSPASSSAGMSGAPGSGAAGVLGGVAGGVELHHQYPSIKADPNVKSETMPHSVAASASPSPHLLSVPTVGGRMLPSTSPLPPAAALTTAAAPASGTSLLAQSSPSPSAGSVVSAGGPAASHTPPASLVSPSHASNILASLHSSPVPFARPGQSPVPAS